MDSDPDGSPRCDGGPAGQQTCHASASEPDPERLLSSLSFDEPGDPAADHRPVSNGPLPADFYTRGGTPIEELEEERARDEVLVSSSRGGGGCAWTEGLKQEKEGPPTLEPDPERPLSSLALDEPGDPAANHRPVRNGSLPADIYAGGGTQIEELKEGRPGDEVLVSSSRGGGGSWTEGSEQEREGPPSPSSSGYAGERGSSVASSGIEEADDARPLVDGWGNGKKHLDEDEGSPSWRKRKKHFFILSNSGKPIYSRYGDEHKLAGFSATLQAIISFVENSGDCIKSIRAGKHQIIFVVKGPICLVCISCTEEPCETLTGQLELIYGQMLLILTKSVNRCLEKNPKFDMSPLLGGTKAVFASLIHAFNWNLATFLHAYTCLPLSCSTRQATSAVLQDVTDSGVIFAILMCKHKVISLVGAQKTSLHPDDILLLANFILSSESFRMSESFSPICLPRYNPMAFLYAYIHFLDVDTFLILLTTNSEAFYHLKNCRILIEHVLLKSNVLSEVQQSMVDGGLHVEDLPIDSSFRSRTSYLPRSGIDKTDPETLQIGGPAGLQHFIYKSICLDQYISSEFSSPLNNPKQQKRLYRAYQKMYTSMHDGGTVSHKTQFRRDKNFVLFCWITQDFELYAAFDPLADKAQAIKRCNSVCQWVGDLENEIFLYGESACSW